MKPKPNNMKTQIKVGIVFAIFGLLITAFNTCNAQDVIYTKQGGIIKGITLTKDDGDTLKYFLTKSNTPDFILKTEVKNYEKNSNVDIYTKEYREKMYEKQVEINTPKSGEYVFDEVDHISNAMAAYAFAQYTTFGGSIMCIIAISVGAAPAVPIVIGTVVFIVAVAKTIEFVKELKLTGKDIVALKRFKK
jgi:hypothetical protein